MQSHVRVSAYRALREREGVCVCVSLCMCVCVCVLRCVCLLRFVCVCLRVCVSACGYMDGEPSSAVAVIVFFQTLAVLTEAD